MKRPLPSYIRPVVPAGAPAATWRDGEAVKMIADAGVNAIVTQAALHGLDSGQWNPDVLYRPIAEVVARAIRATPNWWLGRTQEKA